MPLIFLVSGAGLYYTLQRPNVLRFLKDKVLRLLVPLAFGATTHVALQVYLERRAHGGFHRLVLRVLPALLTTGCTGLGGNFAWMGLHLWYLEVLFVFSVLLLPVFLWLRSSRRSDGPWRGRPVPGAARTGLPDGGAGCAAVPAAQSVQHAVRQHGLGRLGAADVHPLPAGGFMIGSSVRAPGAHPPPAVPQPGDRAGADGRPCADDGVRPEMKPFGTPMYALVGALSCFASWAYVLTILGLCLQHLNRPSPLLARANQAVLPFYILHQSVMIGLGWFIVRWPIPDVAKFVLIAAATLTICLGSYELIIRRFNLTRFLFGMKSLPRPVEERARNAATEPAPTARPPAARRGHRLGGDGATTRPGAGLGPRPGHLRGLPVPLDPRLHRRGVAGAQRRLVCRGWTS